MATKSKTKPEPAKTKKAAIPAVSTDPVDRDRSDGKGRPIEEFPDVADALPELCEEYRQIADQMSGLEERRRELSNLIMPLVEAAGYDSIYGETWHAVRILGKRETLVAERLVEAGVSLAVIKKCTKTVEYHYLQIRNRRLEK